MTQPKELRLFSMPDGTPYYGSPKLEANPPTRWPDKWLKEAAEREASRAGSDIVYVFKRIAHVKLNRYCFVNNVIVYEGDSDAGYWFVMDRSKPPAQPEAMTKTAEVKYILKLAKRGHGVAVFRERGYVVVTWGWLCFLFTFDEWRDAIQQKLFLGDTFTSMGEQQSLGFNFPNATGEFVLPDDPDFKHRQDYLAFAAPA